MGTGTLEAGCAKEACRGCCLHVCVTSNDTHTLPETRRNIVTQRHSVQRTATPSSTTYIHLAVRVDTVHKHQTTQAIQYHWPSTTSSNNGAAALSPRRARSKGLAPLVVRARLCNGHPVIVLSSEPSRDAFLVRVPRLVTVGRQEAAIPRLLARDPGVL